MVDPLWLFDAITFLSSSKEFSSEAAISKEKIGRVLAGFKTPEYKWDDSKINETIELLCDLQICYQVGKSDESPNTSYIIPAVLQERSLPWDANESMTVYAGRRLQCTESTDLIPPGTVAFIQCRMMTFYNDTNPEIWKDGLFVRRKIENQSIEGILTLSNSERAIDIVFRGENDSHGECRKHVDCFVKEVKEVLISSSSNTKVTFWYLSSVELRKGKSDPYAYSEADIENVRRKLRRVNSITFRKKEDLQESLADLCALPPDHYTYLNFEARHKLQDCLKEDSTAEAALAKELLKRSPLKSENTLSFWAKNANATVTVLVRAARKKNLENVLSILDEWDVNRQEESGENVPDENDSSKVIYTCTDISGLHEKVHRRQMASLTLKILNEDNWKFIGRRLKLQDHTITKIDETYKTSREKAYQMLLTWQGCEDSNATVRILRQALYKEGLNADKILSRREKMNTITEESQPSISPTESDLVVDPFLTMFWTVGGNQANISMQDLRFEFPAYCLDQESCIAVSLKPGSGPSNTGSSGYIITVAPHNLSFNSHVTVRMNCESRALESSLWKRESNDGKWIHLGDFGRNNSVQMKKCCDLCVTTYKPKEQEKGVEYKFHRLLFVGRRHEDVVTVEVNLLSNPCLTTFREEVVCGRLLSLRIFNSVSLERALDRTGRKPNLPAAQ